MLCFHQETKACYAVYIAVKIFLKLGTIECGGKKQFCLFLYFSSSYILVRSLRLCWIAVEVFEYLPQHDEYHRNLKTIRPSRHHVQCFVFVQFHLLDKGKTFILFHDEFQSHHTDIVLNLALVVE